MRHVITLCLGEREEEKNKKSIHYYLLYLSKNNDKEEETIEGDDDDDKQDNEHGHEDIYMDTYTNKKGKHRIRDTLIKTTTTNNQLK